MILGFFKKHFEAENYTRKHSSTGDDQQLFISRLKMIVFLFIKNVLQKTFVMAFINIFLENVLLQLCFENFNFTPV